MSSASASSSSSQNRNPAGTNTGHQHKLVPAADAMLRICEGCKDQMYVLGSSFKCTDCKEYLHGACLNAKPNSTKLYPFSPKFSLKFSTEKTDKLCDACCSYIKGIMYTGSHDNKNYHLHPQCLELSPNLGCARLKCKGMNSELELKRFPKMPTNMKCVLCETDDAKGWCYGIISKGDGKFACHVRCLKRQLVKNWFTERIPVKMADRKLYFESLYRKDLEKVTNMIRGLASVVAAVGLDLMISAFVGAPFATIISATLDVTIEFAGKKH